MTKQTLLFSILVLLSAAAATLGQRNAEWLEDYAAIKRYIPEAYANIDWARKKIDLVELDRRTTEGLKQAKSADEADKVFQEFFGAFSDGHLRLQSVNPAQSSDLAPVVISKDARGDEACRSLGFSLRLPKHSLPIQTVAGYSRTGDPRNPFLAGIVPAGKLRIAVISIVIFSADNYFGNCVDAWEAFRAGIDGPCAGDCPNRFRTMAEQRLTERFVAQVRELSREKPDALVIDIGANGGGSNWAETIAAVISRSPVSRPPVKFIRHPHWVKILESQLVDVDIDLLRKDLTKTQLAILRAARKRLVAYLEEARKPCDLSGIWTDSKQKPQCTRLADTPLTNGFAPDAPDEAIAGLNSRNSLKRISPYPFEKGVFDGKLFVLTDQRTASAAEMFASMLQSAKAATIIGGRTFGAGCGFVDGGTQYFLPVSKLRLRMPDCSRFRADGVNEVEGIEPDIRLFAADDTPEAKLKSVIAYFSKMQR